MIESALKEQENLTKVSWFEETSVLPNLFLCERRCCKLKKKPRKMPGCKSCSKVERVRIRQHPFFFLKCTKLCDQLMHGSFVFFSKAAKPAHAETEILLTPTR